jgi:hypothetical protein
LRARRGLRAACVMVNKAWLDKGLPATAEVHEPESAAVELWTGGLVGRPLGAMAMLTKRRKRWARWHAVLLTLWVPLHRRGGHVDRSLRVIA